MKKIKAYIQDTITELRDKVSWPSWKELQSSAIVVMIATFIIAIIVYLMDTSFSGLMTIIYNLF